MKRLLIPPVTSALLLLLAGTFTVVRPAVELVAGHDAVANESPSRPSIKHVAVDAEEPFAPALHATEPLIVPVAYIAPDPKPAEPSTDQQVTLPELPLPPMPPPPPPSAVTRLTAGQLYVITSTQKVLVLGSRDGFIKISSPKTPCTLYGNFVDAKPADDEGRTYASGFVYVVKAAATGQVELIVIPDVSGKGLIRRVLDVDNGVPPVPPVPPKPPDPPVPPDPPTPAPIPGPGFRVMIVYETADLQKMPSKQVSILTTKSVRDYLNTKTTPTTDGGKRGWYIVDQNADFSGESKIWQDAIKRPRTQVPWIIVSNGTSGYEGPLPADVNSAIDLLKKYGGN